MVTPSGALMSCISPAAKNSLLPHSFHWRQRLSCQQHIEVAQTIRNTGEERPCAIARQKYIGDPKGGVRLAADTAKENIDNQLFTRSVRVGW